MNSEISEKQELTYQNNNSNNKNSIKASFIRAGNIKQEFKESKCVIPISVGQPYHEEEYFEATIELIDENFKSCSIIICDTLQRHTIKTSKNCDDISAYDEAKRNGCDWLERNIDAIKKLKIQYNIMKWEDWLKKGSYASNQRQIEELYNNDLEFNQIIKDTAETFLTRFKKREDKYFDYDKAYKNSIEYIKEEMAVMPQWVECGFEFEIYPKERPKAMQMSYERFVVPKYPNLLRRIAIKFSHKK